MRTGDLYYDFRNPSFLAKKEMLAIGSGFITFRYLKDIVSTAISMFKYEGLENACKGLTTKILETALMFTPNLCFYYDKMQMTWVLARYAEVEKGLYLQPSVVNVNAFNGTQIATNVPFEDIIPIRDNDIDLVPFLAIQEYLEKIKYLEDACDLVVNNATLPLLLVGSKKNKLQLQTIAKKIGVKEPYLIGDDTIVDQVKSFDINIPVNPLDIYDLKTKYKNECLGSLGIYSVEQKRERIVTQELVNQNDYTDFVYQARREQRLEAIRELSKRSGVQITLIETYDINQQQSIEEKADTLKATTKAQVEAIKETEPEALINAGSLLGVKKNV